MKSGARLRDKRLSRAWFLAAAPAPEATAVNARSFVVAGAPDKDVPVLGLGGADSSSRAHGFAQTQAEAAPVPIQPLSCSEGGRLR